MILFSLTNGFYVNEKLNLKCNINNGLSTKELIEIQKIFNTHYKTEYLSYDYKNNESGLLIVRNYLDDINCNNILNEINNLNFLKINETDFFFNDTMENIYLNNYKNKLLKKINYNKNDLLYLIAKYNNNHGVKPHGDLYRNQLMTLYLNNNNIPLKMKFGWIKNKIYQPCKVYDKIVINNGDLIIYSEKTIGNDYLDNNISYKMCHCLNDTKLMSYRRC